MRILITGSRDWSDREQIERLLGDLVSERDVVVHGDCPTGADRMAREWAERNGIEHEPHPADWDTHGKAAGPLRNQEMVDLGAGLCLAFLHPESRGTRDCRRRARRAGIPTISLTEG